MFVFILHIEVIYNLVMQEWWMPQEIRNKYK
jgi:hypothetical protein